MSLSTEVQHALTDYFRGHPKVLSAWMFGSHATGQSRADSDVDLAILAESALGWEELSAMYVDLMPILSTDHIDIVELIKAPPILAFEAISGQELTRRDLYAHLDFVSLTSRRYADVCHSLESQMAARAELGCPRD